MSSFNLEVSNPRRSLDEVLRDIPARARPEIRQGFSVLAKVPSDRYHLVLSKVTDSVLGRSRIRTDEVATALGIPFEESGPLLSAASLAVVTLGVQNTPAGSFVEAASASGLLSESDRTGILSFLELIVAQRAGIGQILTESRLGNVVLPVLTDFDVTVDVRLGFDEGRISAAIPVAIVHLDTDSHSQEVWFQVNRRQLERIIADLNSALKEMQAAERWLSARSAG